MTDAYAYFARYYDRFMEEAPYEAWLDWINESIEPLTRHAGDSLRLLDLGCGTGNLAIPLALHGHRVTGTDLSEEMIKVADEKASSLPENARERLTFAVADMAGQPDPSGRAEQTETYDAVICCCDSLNYITEPDQICRVFDQARKALQPGGLLLFDVHTSTQFESYMQEQPYIWNDPDVAYIWTCEMEAPDLIRHDLVLFAGNAGGSFERIEETHRQRYYSRAFLEDRLRAARFEPVQVTADFSPFPVAKESKRAFYIAVALSD